MTTVRLYFDADSMERAVVSGLRARGVDATTALDAGMADCSDEEQLEFAGSEGRVLFSFNVSDFQRLHSDYVIMFRAVRAARGSSWQPSNGIRWASGYAACKD